MTVAGSRWDGSPWSGSGTGDVRWLRYANSRQGTPVGYVFLDQQEVTFGLDKVTHSRRFIRSSNPNTAKNVVGVSIEQPAGAQLSSFAYALVPNAGEQQLPPYTGGPLAVVRIDGTTTVAVSDPTMDRDQISATISDRPLSPVSTDSGISVSSVPGGTLLHVNTHHACGRSSPRPCARRIADRRRSEGRIAHATRVASLWDATLHAGPGPCTGSLQQRS